MSDTLKLILTSIGIGVLVLLLTIFASETLFGDLTKSDSYKPLYVVIPIMASVLYYLVKKTK
jgi:hypothetical protein